MRHRGVLLAVVALLLLAPAVLAQGPEYDLPWWTVDGGGGTWLSGGEYTIGATIGQPDTATLGGGEYGLLLGFWYPDYGPYLVYIPLVPNRDFHAPDLIVVSIVATENDVVIVLRNQGNLTIPARDEFWVDFYVDPDPPPTAVNQTWDQLCEQGLVWGVTAPALPLPPGGEVTLRMGDQYFWPEHSYVEWPLVVGTPVYVQADSANVWTNYGAVYEDHEILGGPYNNVLGPATVGPAMGGVPPAWGGYPPGSGGNLPARP